MRIPNDGGDRRKALVPTRAAGLRALPGGGGFAPRGSRCSGELPVSSEFLNHPAVPKIEMTLLPERDLTVF